MEVAGKTDCGKVRDQNEDAYIADDRLGLLIVADGLGGHAGGHYASRLAVQSLAAAMSEDWPSSNISPLESLIASAFRQATRHIREAASTDYHFRDMGTTVVLALCEESRVWIAHLGDSRAYLLRGHELIQLTQDHSMAEDLVRAGQLSSDEKKAHPLRHVVTRSLGRMSDGTPTSRVEQWDRGDVLVLCTSVNAK
jgi:protein phosphatase